MAKINYSRICVRFYLYFLISDSIETISSQKDQQNLLNLLT